MFKSKCSQCKRKVNKKYEFCPFCGFDLKGGEDDNSEYGFLGKEDLDELGIKMPFGFNMLFKPLMKELSKQMGELDKELKKEAVKSSGEFSKPNFNPMTNMKSFSIHIGMPGQKPIRINSGNMPVNSVRKAPVKKILKLPKISEKFLEKAKSLSRIEPETNVRRLADRIIYEIKIPGVKSVESVNISILETGIEIKAIGKNTLFVKDIEMSMPLIGYSFEKEKLILELGLR